MYSPEMLDIKTSSQNLEFCYYISYLGPLRARYETLLICNICVAELNLELSLEACRSTHVWLGWAGL